MYPFILVLETYVLCDRVVIFSVGQFYQ